MNFFVWELEGGSDGIVVWGRSWRFEIVVVKNWRGFNLGNIGVLGSVDGNSEFVVVFICIILWFFFCSG